LSERILELSERLIKIGQQTAQYVPHLGLGEVMQAHKLSTDEYAFVESGYFCDVRGKLIGYDVVSLRHIRAQLPLFDLDVLHHVIDPGEESIECRFFCVLIRVVGDEVLNCELDSMIK
jgi:hypothetical protein